ncbi:uncharacterized protein LOC116167584 isoform X1 [Photinus pyralis]|uniref:uncharacterized protein LOC116167584 isoform X1 n=1 Tax=Photinus pyralis TaxID=7054 RepID=UPI001266F7DD|nr:uncharacterized protein LOC116167584 isoform X1 [Photinus pyralis]XP_031338837.1 uncharacterized protein LOC116167584 isoform X1 [Photinus pyralis]
MLLILMLLVPLAHSKPQGSPSQIHEENVQIEQQEIREITQRELESPTKRIMEKIKAVNQNLTPRVPERAEFSKQFYNRVPNQQLTSNAIPEENRTGFTHMPYYIPPSAFASHPPQQTDPILENQTIENVRNVISMQVPLPYMALYYPMYPPELYYPHLRQGIQSPLTSYFPIVIKDPIQQLMNAFASMIEYGPPGNNAPPPAAAPCSTVKAEKKEETGKELVIEDLRLSNDNQNPFRFTLTVDTDDTSRDLKNPTVRVNNKLATILSNNKEGDLKANIFPLGMKEKTKNISQDNTGNGIFVQRLRVREGGIAIAGPGGIATAGTGGTAIVGPDGYAYTQPDSIAIAGSGTKVIAVNPGINLTDLINSISKNETKLSPRIGKIVAIGPVVYYNKGP